MKKVLLASTALLAFGAVSAQADEPLKLSIGGFYKNEIAFVTNKAVGTTTATSNSASGKYSRFYEQDYGAVNFVGSTKLDNGITVAVELDTVFAQYNDSRGNCGATKKVNMSASGVVDIRNGTQCNSFVKRDYVTLSSAYGSLIAGEREDIASIVHVTAPDVGWGLADADWPNYVNNRSGFSMVQVTNTTRWTNRSPKVTYVTPAFYGVSAGVSYMPYIQASIGNNYSANSSTDIANFANINYNNAINRSDFAGDAYGAAVAINNTFGPVSVKGDVSVTQLNFASERLIATGWQFGYAGFTLGGSFLNRDIPQGARALSSTNPVTAVSGITPIDNTTLRAAAFVGNSWDLGLAYATGPYSVSFGYFHDQTANSLHRADRTAAYVLSGAYAFGPGMSWRASIYHYDLDSGAADATTKFNQSNNGNGVLTGVQINF